MSTKAEFKEIIANIHADDIFFMTTNKVKANLAKEFGFEVKESELDIPEIKHEAVNFVALHKCMELNVPFALVEDTCLDIEGASFLGTDIKHVWEELKEDDHLNGHKAFWRCAFCVAVPDFYIVSIESQKGFMKYPICETGYHFDSVFAIETPKDLIHFELLQKEEKDKYSPRRRALSKLKKALDTKDFSYCIVIPKDTVLPWTGEYQ